ncbi:hypothetical protein [Streptomyces natalensis]|uniref:Uncharacterized protein n=1 Tax=Streptomyces natalensis ATCC 27448 TaxID=1240678 RepID=A0A0D7CGA9_9ACTN|nr:hypothetical protein [Streptomyces natalensis]KIZ15289.1 hypothetical protein SNA_27280 [Streptomyces natalensis ATCC 27448]
MTDIVGKLAAEDHPTAPNGRDAEVLPRASGVVDGAVSAVSNQDGSVSLHIRVSMPGRVDSDLIEVILPREHKEALAEAIATPPSAARAPHPPAIPCTVGVGQPHP